MDTTNRREFLKRTTATGIAAGLGAAGMLPGTTGAQEKSKNKITTRDFGKTGWKVTEVGFGVMNTRDPELVQAGLEAGINYFDTAHGYMNGVNEEVVGRVMKKIDRKKVYIATKVHCKGRDAKTIREMMETSLKRLQMDYVDVMFMHMPDHGDEVKIKEHMQVFEQFKKDGHARLIGVSTHVNHAETINATVDTKFWEALLVGYNFNSTPDVTEAMERARKAGLAMIAMKTQAKGKGYTGHNMGDISIQQAALKWVLQHSFVDTTIPGVTNFEQLAENVAVMGMKMSFIDHLQLKRYAEASKDAYCCGVAGCTGCQGQCPYGVQVSEINRCLGYAYGYGDKALARENYDRLPASSRIEKCGDCGECLVKCVNGLNLTENIGRARELFA